MTKNTNAANENIADEIIDLIKDSPYLSNSEKERIIKIIPLISKNILKDLRKSLIRQNLHFLQIKK